MIGVSVLTVLVLSVCSVLVSSQYVPPSPCPDIFMYKREGQQVHGVIRYQPSGQLKYIFVRASFAISATAPSTSYAGQLEVLGSKELALLKMLRGQALDYRVDFASVDPLPRLVSLAVNGHVLCSGEPDSSGPNKVFTLDYLLFDKGDELSPLALNFGNTPQTRPPERTTPKPVPLSRPTDAECGVVSGGNDQVGLVYYGTAVSPGDWPWLVAIFTRRDNGIYYTCAGSLVSNQHVVTAGHCMSRKGIVRPLRDFVLKVGAFNLDYIDDPRVSLRGVKAAALHTDYNTHTLANDALILHMDAPVIFTKLIRPICLWESQTDQNIITGKHASVVGWGGNEIQESGRGEPRMASIPIVSTDDCRASRIEFHKLTSTATLCAGYRNGTGPCNGDSGSGLYMFSGGRWRLRGVVSVSLRPVTGEAKCNLNEYVIFTDVAQYLPWLQQHLQGQSDWSQISQLPQAPSTLASEPECGVVSGGNEHVALIYYGMSAAPGEWPWLVALFRRKNSEQQFICGGTLVSNQHVITAAHCQGRPTSVTPPKDLTVRAGIFDLNSFSDNVVTRGIKDVIVHPGYSSHINYMNNIAILKLEQAMSFTAYIRPICLWDEDTDLNMVIDKRGVVTGWGFTEDGTIGKSAPRVASLPIVSFESCIRSNADLVKFVTPNTFCAGDRNGTSPCNGDSGGGLYMLRAGRWRLRGIISLALAKPDGKCNVNEYTVFTDVAQYLPWLKQNLQSDWPQISQLPQAPPTLASEPECGVVSGGNEHVALIYYGMSAAPGEWPWLVALFKRINSDQKFICGGTLVSNQHVITAAHCQGQAPSVTPPKDLTVRAGIFDLNSFSDNVVTRGIKDVFVHPGYSPHINYINNIAILKLEQAMSFTAYIRPICLWDEDTDLNMVIDKRGVVTGWGFTEDGTIDESAPRVASLPIVSSESCIRSNADLVKLVTRNTFCAGDRNGTSPCNGDSGGGLYMLREGRWRLRGIISLALAKPDGKCNVNEYTVFTDVAQYLPWLKQKLYDN